jgi:ABC-2 type transporter
MRLISSRLGPVVASLQQPSRELFFIFTHLMLLNKGKIVYFGNLHKAMCYFAELGYPCPRALNPAEYFTGMFGGYAFMCVCFCFVFINVWVGVGVFVGVCVSIFVLLFFLCFSSLQPLRLPAFPFSFFCFCFLWFAVSLPASLLLLSTVGHLLLPCLHYLWPVHGNTTTTALMDHPWNYTPQPGYKALKTPEEWIDMWTEQFRSNPLFEEERTTMAQLRTSADSMSKRRLGEQSKVVVQVECEAEDTESDVQPVTDDLPEENDVGSTFLKVEVEDGYAVGTCVCVCVCVCL